MKWIKNRERFLKEAKIRDVIYPRQAKAVRERWGEKYLDYEEVDPTDKIKQGKWKLSEEDKIKVLNKFFSVNSDTDISNIFKMFEELPEKFVNILNQSLDFDLLGEDKEVYTTIFGDNFDIRKPTIDQISCLFEPVFRKLSVNDTKSNSMIQKDENGRPIKDEEGNMIRVEKEPGDPVYERNLVNFKGFSEAYNRSYDETVDFEKIYHDRNIQNLVSLTQENHNRDFKFDFKIFDRDLYLSINHSARDILNMSISRFYASCQHLYTGSHRESLLSNVFDPNSIPAFLIFDTPIFWGDEKISDFLPLTRMIVRNIETFDDSDKESPKIFFDRAYPDRMKDVFAEIIEKYSGNKENVKNSPTYMFMPDIDTDDNLKLPYMDRLNISKVPYIGKNTKSIYLTRNYDWSRIKISPNANIKELVVETDILPDNISEMKFKPDWIKFKYMKITNLEPFNKIKTDSIAFEKCQLNSNILDEMIDELKKIQITSCIIKGEMDLSKFPNLEELHLVFTLDDLEELKSLIEGLKLKKLVISGDLFLTPESKDYLKSLKSKMKVEIKGPII